MNTPDTSAAFFDAMYQASQDPWNFSADPYEQFRYRTILQALQPGPYRRAFEPGCSVGALTVGLATICERVDACDFSQAAADQARGRCLSLPGVTVRCMSLNNTVSYAEYDLIVLSEVGYYFSTAAWQCLVNDILDSMQPGTTLLASHWLGNSQDHVLSGDEVHNMVKHPQLRHEHGERHPDKEHGGFRLDKWRKCS